MSPATQPAAVVPSLDSTTAAAVLPVALNSAAAPAVGLVSFDTATTESAVAEGDETPAVTWFQCACAEACLDKGASLSVKADVGRLGGGGAMRAVLTKVARMWDNGSVGRHSLLAFLKVDRDLRNSPTPSSVGMLFNKRKVKTVVQEWVKYVNVRLTFVANGNATIRISFDPRSGSWSYVGNEVVLTNAIETTMNLDRWYI